MKRLPILGLAFLFVLFFAQTTEAASSYCATNIDRIIVHNRNKSNAFASASRTVNITIFDFSLEYAACGQNSPKVVAIKEILFSIVAANLLEIKDFEKIYAKDVLTGKIYPAQVKEANLPNWAVVVNLQVELQDQKEKKFQLIADLPNMKPKAGFNITFQTSLMSKFLTTEGETLLAHDDTGSAISHFNGNRPPKLWWPNFTQNVKSTVSPQSGLSGEYFEFRIEYSDADNEPPKIAQVWVDLNGDGKYQPNEKFDMAQANPKQTNFSSETEFFRSLKIVVKKPQLIKYRFYFTDSKVEAESGVPIPTEVMPETVSVKPTDEFSFMVGMPVAFGPIHFQDQFVSGEPLKIVVPIFYLYRDLEINWASIAQNNFKPFRLLYWQLGRHGIASPEYKMPAENFDFQEIILFLDTGNIKSKTVNLPPLKVRYGLKDTKGQFETQSEKQTLSPVFLRIENGASQQLVRIGDQFTYWIKVVRSQEANLVDFKPKEIYFEPYEIIRFEKKSENRGQYIVDEYIWTLASFYAIQDPIPLPSFEINWRHLASSKINTHKIQSIASAMVPVLGKDDNVISQWDTGILVWPNLKDLLIGLTIVIGSAILLIFFGYLAVRRVMIWLAVWQESRARLFRLNRRRAKRLLRFLLNSQLLSLSQLVDLLNNVKALIGLNFGMDISLAQALTASEIENLVKDPSHHQVLNLLTLPGSNIFVLKQMEEMIFNSNLATEYSELREALYCLKKFLKKINYSPRPN